MKAIFSWALILVASGTAFGQGDPTKTNKLTRSAKKELDDFVARLKGIIKKEKLTRIKLFYRMQKDLTVLLKSKALDSFFDSERLTPGRKFALLFQWVLRRAPTKAETESMTRHLKSTRSQKQFFHDVLWALYNTREFLLSVK